MAERREGKKVYPLTDLEIESRRDAFLDGVSFGPGTMGGLQLDMMEAQMDRRAEVRRKKNLRAKIVEDDL